MDKLPLVESLIRNNSAIEETLAIMRDKLGCIGCVYEKIDSSMSYFVLRYKNGEEYTLRLNHNKDYFNLMFVDVDIEREIKSR